MNANSSLGPGMLKIGNGCLVAGCGTVGLVAWSSTTPFGCIPHWATSRRSPMNSLWRQSPRNR